MAQLDRLAERLAALDARHAERAAAQKRRLDALREACAAEAAAYAEARAALLGKIEAIVAALPGAPSSCVAGGLRFAWTTTRPAVEEVDAEKLQAQLDRVRSGLVSLLASMPAKVDASHWCRVKVELDRVGLKRLADDGRIGETDLAELGVRITPPGRRFVATEV